MFIFIIIGGDGILTIKTTDGKEKTVKNLEITLSKKVDHFINK